MKGISIFFDKFKNVAIKELNKREVIVNSIYKIIKYKIEIKDIEIKKNIILIKGNQGLKSEIFINKKDILSQIIKDSNIKIINIK